MLFHLGGEKGFAGFQMRKRMSVSPKFNLEAHDFGKGELEFDVTCAFDSRGRIACARRPVAQQDN